MKATFVSVWDGGIEVVTNCNFDTHTRIVSDIEYSNVDGIEVLDDEYVILEDDTRLKVLNFDKFQSLWIEQETNKCDDTESYIEVLDECTDFDELFMVISIWSHKPLIERVNDFLIRNNACYYVD